MSEVVLPVSTDPSLIFLSYCMIVFAVHTTNQLIDEAFKTKSDRLFHIWVLTASISVTLGGVFVMHFIGTNGLSLPGVPLTIDPGITAAAGAVVLALGYPALLLTAVAARDDNVDFREIPLKITRLRFRVPRRRRYFIIIGALLLAPGVFAMHFLGTNALKSPTTTLDIQHHPIMALHFVFTIVIALVALIGIVHLEGSGHRFLISFVLGAGACSVHYLGNLTLTFAVPSDYQPTTATSSLWISIVVGAMSTFIRFVASAMLQVSFFMERTFLRVEINKLRALLKQAQASQKSPTEENPSEQAVVPTTIASHTDSITRSPPMISRFSTHVFKKMPAFLVSAFEEGLDTKPGLDDDPTASTEILSVKGGPTPRKASALLGLSSIPLEGLKESEHEDVMTPSAQSEQIPNSRKRGPALRALCDSSSQQPPQRGSGGAFDDSFMTSRAWSVDHLRRELPTAASSSNTTGVVHDTQREPLPTARYHHHAEQQEQQPQQQQQPQSRRQHTSPLAHSLSTDANPAVTGTHAGGQPRPTMGYTGRSRTMNTIVIPNLLRPEPRSPSGTVLGGTAMSDSVGDLLCDASVSLPPPQQKQQQQQQQHQQQQQQQQQEDDEVRTTPSLSASAPGPDAILTIKTAAGRNGNNNRSGSPTPNATPSATPRSAGSQDGSQGRVAPPRQSSLLRLNDSLRSGAGRSNRVAPADKPVS